MIKIRVFGYKKVDREHRVEVNKQIMVLKDAILPLLDEIRVQDSGAKIIVGERFEVTLVADLAKKTWEKIENNLVITYNKGKKTN